MATAAEPPEEMPKQSSSPPSDFPRPSEEQPKPTSPQPSNSPVQIESKTLEQVTPWIDYAVQQALEYQKLIRETVASTLEASRERLSQIRSTSSAHFDQTIYSLQDVKSQFDVYESMAVGKVKEGIYIAASHPLITGSAAIGLSFLGLKRPRHFLYYTAVRLFSSEEALLSKADVKVRELRQSIDRLKAESDKLLRIASVAEEELIRGRKKLGDAGKQIQSAIHSAYKIERQADGLRDILRELPRREATVFRSQVSKLASEVKRGKNAMTREVSKIVNYGISV